MWEKVPFSDESSFWLFANQANTYVRRFSGEVFKPEFLNLTVKHPVKITWSAAAFLLVELDVCTSSMEW